MAELSMDPDNVRVLIAKAQEALTTVPSEEDEDPVSEIEIDAATTISKTNEDRLSDENRRDLSLDEVARHIDNLNVDERAEIVALVWIGRGDFEPRDFADAVREARDYEIDSVSDYLLQMPLFPSHLGAGLDAVAE